MDEFELTYEHYEQTLRKRGWTPKSREVFESGGVAHAACVYLYIVASQEILAQFKADMRTLDATEEGENDEE